MLFQFSSISSFSPFPSSLVTIFLTNNPVFLEANNTPYDFSQLQNIVISTLYIYIEMPGGDEEEDNGMLH